MKSIIFNIKAGLRIILSLLLVICLFLAIASPALAATKPNVKYTTTNAVGIKTYMGTYKPGTLTISTSRVPDAGRNIQDSLALICYVAKSLPGCSFIRVEDQYVLIKPDVRYQVWLHDAGNNRLVWNGYLNSGEDIRLGNDHPNGYKIYIASTRYNDCFLFVGLVPKS